ncbi:MAG: hypothetical protein KJN99_10720, partial [Marinicaulis sp.]|nr:hypothetical protein [Marinicaulis sp.]
MTFGVVALVVVIAAAAVLLLRVAKGEGAGGDNLTILKFLVLLGLAAALFAAKLWPIAFMVLIAAGGVMAIESWRDKHIADGEPAAPPAKATQTAMTVKEAAA